MPEAISTPNLVALPITSQELGRGALPPTKIGLSNSPTTIVLNIISGRCYHVFEKELGCTK